MKSTFKTEYDVLQYEKSYYRKGFRYVCGVDEAGRGPLAGPVCAAAVILPEGLIIEGVNDSKKLTEKKREALFDVIREQAAAWSVAWASVEEIEERNILNAAMLAMRRAIEGLDPQPDFALIDGNRRPETDIPSLAIVKGDSLSHSIAAASILAKVSRDRLMLTYAEQYPQYHFEKHKGYGTKLHEEMLREYGPCEIHRPSFLKKYQKKFAEERERTARQVTGDYGEEYVWQYLQKKGYELVCRNYRSRHGEIDLIVRDGENLVFVEVKTRDIGSAAPPIASVDAKKRKRIVTTSLVFLQEHPCDLCLRYDVAELVINPEEREPYLNYWEDAFRVDDIDKQVMG